MNLHPTNKQHQLYKILIMTLTLCPLALIAHLLGIQIGFVRLFSLLILIEAVLWYAFINPILYGVSSLLIFGGLYSLYAWQHPLFSVLEELWWSFYINFGNYLAGYDLLRQDNTYIALLLIAILFILLTRLVLTKTTLHFIYFSVSLSYLIYGWYLHVDPAYYYIILHCALYLIFYTMKSYLQEASLHQTIAFRGQESLFGKWLSTSGRYLLIILILALLLPSANPLVVWQDVEDHLTTMYPQLKDLRHDIEESRTFSSAELFNLSQTGYSPESGILGGPVELNDEIALEVVSPYPLYLRGNVLTQYDGRQWSYGQRLKVEKDTDKQLLREVAIGQEILVRITPKNLNSFTLFTPYQVNRVSIERSGKLWIDINQQVTLLGARYKDETYELSAIIPEDSLAASQGSAAILFNREDYLQLPDDLPERVGIFAATHSAEGQTNYEKAQLLTSYLRQHYTYSLSPNYLPVGEDFVDYFLFEEPEGYCTYFATSLSVLLRTLDIPTRYVEGFRTPDQTTDGKYLVSLSHGHAWVEAYFDGYGWVTLEATPAYQPPVSPTDTKRLIAEETLDLYSLEDEKAYIMAMGDTEQEVTNPDDRPLEEDQRLGLYLAYIKSHLVLIIFISFLSLIAGRILYLKKQYRNYNKRPTSPRKLVQRYHNITELFGHAGYPRYTGETTNEYARRVKKQFYDAAHDFEMITHDYQLVKYGQVLQLNQKLETMTNYFIFVDHRLKHKLGRLSYYQLKYISGKLYTRHPENTDN